MMTRAADGRDTIVLLASRVGMGGAERHTIALANLLAKDFRVVVAYLKPEEDMIGLLDRRVLLEVRCLHASKRIDLRAARELADLATQHGAKAILCANAFALMYAQLARFYAPSRLSIVEIFHTTKLRTLKEHLEQVFYRPFFWISDHLVFVCNTQRAYWRRRIVWSRRNHTIYNGVDMAHFDPTAYEPGVAQTRARYGWSIDDRVVGICAVLRPEKAHVDLVAAIARLRDQGQHWNALFVGDGPMRAVIERDIERLGLQRNIKITGFQSDVRESLAACDLMALVSTSIETFSIAALESMAMGKPMVMSDVGGAREQVTHGVHGMLFPAGDVAALAACLGECRDKTVVRAMGVAARARVRAEFSVGEMVDRYVRLLAGICGRDRSSASTRPS